MDEQDSVAAPITEPLSPASPKSLVSSENTGYFKPSHVG